MFGNIIENVSEAVDNTVDSVSNLNAGDLLEDFMELNISDPNNNPETFDALSNTLDMGNIWEQVTDGAQLPGLDDIGEFGEKIEETIMESKNQGVEAVLRMMQQTGSASEKLINCLG